MWHSSGQWDVSKSLIERVSLSTHTEKPKPCSEWRCDARGSIHHATMKTKVNIIKNGRAERSDKSLLTLLNCCSLPRQPTSTLLVIREKQTPIYLGPYKSGFQLLIAGRLPDMHTHTHLLFLRNDKGKSLSSQWSHSWLPARNQFPLAHLQQESFPFSPSNGNTFPLNYKCFLNNALYEKRLYPAVLDD